MATAQVKSSLLNDYTIMLPGLYNKEGRIIRTDVVPWLLLHQLFMVSQCILFFLEFMAVL